MENNTHRNLEKRHKISIVIPAFNEQESIGEIVSRIIQLDIAQEIIVVDDGSSDSTASVARSAGAEVIQHPYNLGNGAAIKSGVRKCSGDWIIFLDADGQHQPEEIPRLVKFFDRYDMVVGARKKNSSISRFRTVGNVVLTWFAEFLSGNKIMDLTSGFRAIRRNIILDYLHLLPDKYSYPTTITLAVVKSGHFVHYEFIDSIQMRMKGKSKIKPFRDGIRFLNIILRIIVLFNPGKVFMPIALALMTLGVGLSIVQLIFKGGILGGALVLIISGLLVFCFGLIADQISNLRMEFSRRNQIYKDK